MGVRILSFSTTDMDFVAIMLLKDLNFIFIQYGGEVLVVIQIFVNSK